MPLIGRQTVDYSQYPDLIVIYLGMRMESPAGLGHAAARAGLVFHLSATRRHARVLA